jgi:multidrug efflux pump subunit AcrA (membrane-fusion protein)
MLERETATTMDVPRTRRRDNNVYYLAVGVALLLLAITAGFARLRDAPPNVHPDSVWIDTVRRGALVREVSAPGTLVPEEIRLVTAATEGRVERILVEPGSAVERQTILLELSNPDLEVRKVEADESLTRAKASLVDLRQTLNMEVLSSKSNIATIRLDYNEAKRRADAAIELSRENLLAELELTRILERAEGLERRLELGLQHGQALRKAIDARIAAQQAQVDGALALSRLRASQLAGLKVQAGLAGVLQQNSVEVGQRLPAGTLLATVVEPNRLKGQLRVPEARARELALGQTASVNIHGSSLKGRVVRIDPTVQSGTVNVDVAMDDPLPMGARPDLSIDGQIEIEHLKDVVYTGRPAHSRAGATLSLFKVVDEGGAAVRVRVKFGGQSADEAEIVDGLVEGDRVILSDMSQWDSVDRIVLK